jgi:hypothetical protein
MKFSRLTNALINVALVVLILVLVKVLIAVPGSAGAAQSRDYKVVPYPSTGQNVEQMLNDNARDGWRFVFAFEFGRAPYSLIFER